MQPSVDPHSADNVVVDVELDAVGTAPYLLANPGENVLPVNLRTRSLE